MNYVLVDQLVQLKEKEKEKKETDHPHKDLSVDSAKKF